MLLYFSKHPPVVLRTKLTPGKDGDLPFIRFGGQQKVIFLIILAYFGTVHFRRITSIYQPTNEHVISYKTLLKHSDIFRSCQIIIREICSLLKSYYSIHNSIRI